MWREDLHLARVVGQHARACELHLRELRIRVARGALADVLLVAPVAVPAVGKHLAASWGPLLRTRAATRPAWPTPDGFSPLRAALHVCMRCAPCRVQLGGWRTRVKVRQGVRLLLILCSARPAAGSPASSADAASPASSADAAYDYNRLYTKLWVEGAGYKDSNFTGNEQAYLPLVRALLDGEAWSTNGNVQDPVRIASMGCGVCASLPRLKELRDADVYGMDVSSSAIATAKALGRGRHCARPPCLRQGSLTSLPWGDGGLDLIISSDVLEHIHPQDVGRTVAELTRVATGVLLLSIASGSSVTIAAPGEELHLTQRPSSWWLQHFETAGWTSANVSYELWHHIWTARCPSVRRFSKEACPWHWRGPICKSPTATHCGSMFFAFGKTPAHRAKVEAAAAKVLRDKVPYSARLERAP